MKFPFPTFLQAYISTLLILCWSSASAFYEVEEIVRTDYRIDIDIAEHQATVTLQQTLYNNSASVQATDFVFPLPEKMEGLRFFVDGGARDHQVLEGRDRLDYLFEKAHQAKHPMYFRMGDAAFQKVLTTPLTLAPGSETRLKLAYKTPVDFVHDMSFIQVFLHDEKPSRQFSAQLRLSESGPITIFESPLFPNALIEREGGRVAFLDQEGEYTPAGNALFLWSQVPNPTLHFRSQGETYFGHFFPRAKHPHPTQAVIVLDVSGSMTGDAWRRSKDYVHFLLELLGEKTQVSVALVDEEVRWYEEGFAYNDASFRQNLLERLRSKKPVGSSRLYKIFEATSQKDFWSVDVHHRAFFLLTDSPTAIPYVPEMVTAPVITLHFRHRDGTQLDLLSYFSGGFFQPLFRTPPRLIEATDFLRSWETWSYSTPREHFPIPQTQDRVPRILQGGDAPRGPLALSRAFSGDFGPSSPMESFLPRLWGMRRLGDLLHTYDLSESSLQAMLSIAHRFGISLGPLRPHLSLAEWKNALEQMPPSSLERLASQLQRQSLSQLTPIPTVEGLPFYQNDHSQIWWRYDFHEHNRPETMLEIRPFSEEQRRLFREAPQLVAKSFALGQEVAFCVTLRCLVVREGAPVSSYENVFLDFEDLSPDHWSYAAFRSLLHQGILPRSRNGKVHPGRAIDRGTFAEWLVGTEIRDKKRGDKSLLGGGFADVEEEARYSEAVAYLKAKGVVQGYQKDNTFRPYQSLTRAEGVKMKLALAGVESDLCQDAEYEVGSRQYEECQKSSPFPDIGGWEKPWVTEAYRRGWVKGFPDGTFRPHQTLTRGEAAVLLLRE